jgi:aminomethyltransferase
VSSLLRTPLHQSHLELGARIVDFAGWEMPIQYKKGIMAEHQTVRTGAGLFDVSHMGRIRVQGPDAARFLDRLITSDIAGLRPGRARYGLLCDEQGGILDDLVTARLEEGSFLAVCNAASWDRVMDWLQARLQGLNARIVPQRDETAMIALQGPKAVDILTSLTPDPVAGLRRFGIIETTVASNKALVSRTGYTGEDGFEVIVSAEEAAHLWHRLAMHAEPCGLGARDTLRLEAGLLLYGQDMDTTTTPLEAGLERFVSLEKEFVGAEVLRRQAKEGVTRRIAGFTVEGRASPRHGYTVRTPSGAEAAVTSGSFSPSLETGIGLAYFPVNESAPGTRVEADIRGRVTEGVIVPLPFYKK